MAYPYDDTPFQQTAVPGGLLGTMLQPQVQPQQAAAPAPRSMSLGGLIADNPGFLAGITALSMLANNNGRRSFGQLLGRGGLDALGALGTAGMMGYQQERQKTQDAFARAQWEAAQQDRAFDRQLALSNLALSRSLSLGKMQDAQAAAARQADFDAALSGAGGIGGAGGTVRPMSSGAPAIPDGSDPYSIAVQSESGGNPWAISPDRGGSTSYGRFQFNTLPGNSMWQFINYLKASRPELYQALGGGAFQPGTADFNKAWKAASASPAAGQMADAQNAFFREQFINPALARLRGTGIDAFMQNPAFVQMLASTAAQHGVGGAARILSNAWKGVDKSQSPEAQLEALVRGTYAGRSDPREFINQLKEDPNFMAKVRPRFAREQEQILGMLRGGQNPGQGRSPNAPGGTSPEVAAIDAEMQRLTGLLPSAPNTESREKTEAVIRALREKRNALTGDRSRSDSDQQRLFDNERNMRKDFDTASTAYMDSGRMLTDLLSSAKGNSGIGDVAMVYAMMKMFDPTSVVREGEFATAKNAAGVDERVRAAWNSLIGNGKLSAEQRRQMISLARDYFGTRAYAQRGVNDRFRRQAKDYGLNADRIVYDPYATLMSEANDWLKANPVMAAAPVHGQSAPAQGGQNVPPLKLNRRGDPRN